MDLLKNYLQNNVFIEFSAKPVTDSLTETCEDADGPWISYNGAMERIGPSGVYTRVRVRVVGQGSYAEEWNSRRVYIIANILFNSGSTPFTNV